MKLGIAGIGKMGAAIAVRLIEAGHDVTVWTAPIKLFQSVSYEVGQFLFHTIIRLFAISVPPRCAFIEAAIRFSNNFVGCQLEIFFLNNGPQIGRD
jgi:hypothetical protein